MAGQIETIAYENSDTYERREMLKNGTGENK